MAEKVLTLAISAFLFYAITRTAMDTFFSKRPIHGFCTWILWSIFIAVDCCLDFLIREPVVIIIVQSAICIFFCHILYGGGIARKTIWILTTNLMGMVSEIMVGCLLLILGVGMQSYSMVGSISSKIVLLSVFTFIKAKNKYKLKKDIPLGFWAVLCMVPVGGIFILHSIFSLAWECAGRSAYVIALISSGLLIGIIFVIFRVYENLVDYSEGQRQAIAYKKQIQLYEENARIQDESNTRVLKIRHDMKNHLVCIKEFISKGNYSKASDYIDDIMHAAKFCIEEQRLNTGNAVVDAIMNSFITRAKNAGIVLETRVEIPPTIKIADTDLCVIIGNCLDNAMEAVSKLQKDKRVTAEIVYRKSMLLINVTNCYSGELKKDGEGNLLTTKADFASHGTGLHSVLKVIEKNKGTCQMDGQDGVFRIQIMLYA